MNLILTNNNQIIVTRHSQRKIIKFSNINKINNSLSNNKQCHKLKKKLLLSNNTVTWMKCGNTKQKIFICVNA